MQDVYVSGYKSLKNPDVNEFLLLCDDLNCNSLEKVKNIVKSEFSNDEKPLVIKTGTIADIANTTQLLPQKRMTRLIELVIHDMKKIPETCDVWDALTGNFEYIDGAKHEIIARLIPQIYRFEQKKAFKYALHRPKPYSKYHQLNELLLSQACDEGATASSLVVSFFDNQVQLADYNFAEFINNLLESPVGDWNRLLNQLNLSNIEHGIVLPIVTFIDLTFMPNTVIKTAIPIQYITQAFKKVRDTSGFGTIEYYDSPKCIRWQIIDEKTTFAD